jgi:hypothetical protein
VTIDGRSGKQFSPLAKQALRRAWQAGLLSATGSDQWV